MKHLLTFTKTCWAVILVAAIGFESYGCSDSASISEDVAVPLSSLTITPGALLPGFFKNTTSYTVKAPTGAPTVTVTATPKDSTTTMTVNGVVTASGQGRSVPLGVPGSTVTIVIVLASQNGLETTYTIAVTKLLSNDNNLKTLDVTGGTLKPSPFNPGTLDYTVDVASTVEQPVTVTATKADKDATVLISSGGSSVTAGPGVNPGELPVTLGGPGTATPVSVELTAPNGTLKTYRIIINQLSGDNTLSEVKVKTGSVEQFVDLNNPPYTVSVATDTTSVIVTATKSDRNAAMIGHIIAGEGIPTGTTTRDLGPPGPEVNIDLFITVAAPDPTVRPKDYEIKIKRSALSSNANLSALIVTADPLGNPSNHPIDLSSLQPYVVNVAANVAIVTVTARPEDTNATMTIKKADEVGEGVPLLSDTASPIITVGAPGSDTDILVTVTAVNGAQKPYTIKVHVDELAPPPSP